MKVAEPPSAATGRPNLLERLVPDLRGWALFPLVVLFLLNFVEEFDQYAFGILAPEIRDAFGLSDAGIGLIRALAGGLVWLAVPLVGYLADRYNRVRISVLGAVVWGFMALATGLVPVTAVWLLAVVRFSSGVGKLVTEPVHTSLLADYYPPTTRGRVYGFHRSANAFGAILAPGLAGLIALFLGWRATFILLAIPTFIVAAVAMRLPEPLRGGSEDREAAEEAAREEPVPFARGMRWLYSVPTLKRIYIGAFFGGVGAISFGLFVPIFLNDVFGLNEFQRGALGSIGGVFALVGFLTGGRITDRLQREKTFAHIALFYGGAVSGIGLFLIPYAAAPALWMVVPLGFVVGFFLGAWLPPYLTIIGYTSPARIRSLGFSFAGFFFGLGTFGAVVIGAISDAHGIRWALGSAGVLLAIGGAILASSAKFVNADVERAVRVLAEEARLRAERLEAKQRSLLVIRDVDVSYDQTQVLFGVDMEIKEGEVVALLGTNGAGKSTLLRAISGLVHPSGGAILFDGRDITHYEPEETMRAGIVQMPGGRAIFPTLTVAEHLRAAGWLYRRDAAYLEEATREVLEIFPRLKERYHERAGDLSGGEQQMLALGMAFIGKPKLLMIDELSLGLAPIVVEQLLGIVRRIRDAGTTIILVEQSVNIALTVADRAYFLEKGEVRFEGPAAELVERDDIVRSVFLEGAARPGRAQARAERRAPSDAEPVLSVVGLTKRFGGVLAVDDVSFDLPRGGILGIIGPNGAGKTTVFDLISGYLRPDGGRTIFDGEDVTAWGPDRRARAGLGRSFQDARLVSSLTVTENLALALERHLRVRDHLAAALNLPGVVLQEQDVAWTVEDLVELMSLGAFRNKFVRELSTGSRRIVDLAMCIAHDPKVLLLDEPSSGIAQRETEALGPLLRRIQQETGCSLLVIEHDMPLITSISDEIVALDLGRVIARDVPAGVIRDPAVVTSYLGGDAAVIQRSGAKS